MTLNDFDIFLDRDDDDDEEEDDDDKDDDNGTMSAHRTDLGRASADSANARARERARAHRAWTRESWALDPGIFDVVRERQEGDEATDDERGDGEGNAPARAMDDDGKEGGETCAVDGCSARRSEFRGAGLCEKHRHAKSFVISGANGGAPMRWCFYCHRAHDVGAFSSVSRSICHEKFTLRRERRKAARVVLNESAVGEKKSDDSGETSIAERRNAENAEDGTLPMLVAALGVHVAQAAPHGADAKFWVAHPRELQERMDMWNLVRRLNSQDEPAGMYGTIVPGCVRLTVRGWRSIERLRSEPSLECRLRLAFGDEVSTIGDVLYNAVSVSEMKASEFAPRRVDAHGGVFVSAEACEAGGDGDGRRLVLVDAKTPFAVDSLGKIVRFFSEYIDCEKTSDTMSRVVVVDVLSNAKSSSNVIDHVLSVQVGGYGAAYEHYAVITDEDIARELKTLEASVSDDVKARKSMRDFALDYVWLSSTVDRAMLYDNDDVARARFILASARVILDAAANANIVRAARTLERLKSLEEEIEELAKHHLHEETTEIAWRCQSSSIAVSGRSTSAAIPGL